MAREIPGFYFDEEKGKYFRIQQSHRVVPGTGYTKQTVKAVEQTKQDEQRAAEQIKRSRSKIIRSTLLKHTNSPLLARLGTSPQYNRDEVLRQYGAGLSRCFIDAHGPPYPNGDGFLGSNFSLTRSGILFAGYKSASHHVDHLPHSSLYPWPQFDEALDLPSVRFSNCNHQVFPYSDLVVSVYNGDGLEGLICSNCSSRLSFNTIESIDANGAASFSDTSTELELSPLGIETIWDLAVAPSRPIVAVASNVGLDFFTYLDQLSTPYNRTVIRRLKQKEQMNVSFKDSYIAMSGERSGRVNFSDTRVDGGDITRLLHSSAVLGTQSLRGGNHVLVHGFSTTSTYDLRFVQQTPVAPSARSTNLSSRSTPYLTFAVPPDRHSDHYTRGRKVAYSAELDLVAAVNATTSRPRTPSFVTLYSARTGRPVPSPLTSHVYRDAVRSVDIHRLRDGPESVLVLAERCLDEWAFAKFSRDELRDCGVPLDERLQKRNGVNWEG